MDNIISHLLFADNFSPIYISDKAAFGYYYRCCKVISLEKVAGLFLLSYFRPFRSDQHFFLAT